MFHYVYAMYNSFGEFYVGVRSCLWPPEYDIKYRGSGSWCLYSIEYERRKKHIVSIHATRENANRREAMIIQMTIGSPMCRNTYGKKSKRITRKVEA